MEKLRVSIQTQVDFHDAKIASQTTHDDALVWKEQFLPKKREREIEPIQRRWALSAGYVNIAQLIYLYMY